MGPLVLDIEGTVLTEADIRRISDPLVGMVILFTRNYENREQLTKLCHDIHAVKPGLLIAVDHEGGRVQALHKSRQWQSLARAGLMNRKTLCWRQWHAAM